MNKITALFGLSWTVVKLVGLMLLEAVCIGLFVAIPVFFICYTCDMWWGEHILVKTADRCYMISLCIGLVTGAVGTWLSTNNVRKKILGK